MIPQPRRAAPSDAASLPTVPASELMLAVLDDSQRLRLTSVALTALLAHLGESVIRGLASCDGPVAGKRCTVCPIPDANAASPRGYCTFRDMASAVDLIAGAAAAGDIGGDSIGA